MNFIVKLLKALFILQIVLICIGIAHWGDYGIFPLDWTMFVLTGLIGIVVVILGIIVFAKKGKTDTLTRISIFSNAMGLVAFLLFHLLRNMGIITYYASLAT